jgi:hypothetical protein
MSTYFTVSASGCPAFTYVLEDVTTGTEKIADASIFTMLDSAISI